MSRTTNKHTPKRREPREYEGATDPTKAVEWGGIIMHPFTSDGCDYAVSLAETVSTYEAADDNVALALLICGLAATEDADERQAIAYFCVERVLAKSYRFKQAMNKYMAERRERHTIGTV